MSAKFAKIRKEMRYWTFTILITTSGIATLKILLLFATVAIQKQTKTVRSGRHTSTKKDVRGYAHLTPLFYLLGICAIIERGKMSMKIHTFKTEKYRKCPIYLRNFKDHFEYLTIINGELYTAHIRVRPHWLTKLFYRLDITTSVDKMPYSQQQLKNILKQVRAMAEATIDIVLDKKA